MIWRLFIIRLGNTLQHRPVCVCTAKPLHQLVPDIPGIQIGENQYVRPPAYGAAIKSQKGCDMEGSVI